MEKLRKIDEIHMEEMMDKLFKREIDNITMLMLFYTQTGTSMIYCDAMLDINLESDLKKKEEMYKDLYLKQSEEECKIHTEIYEKYNYMYLKIIDNNSIPNYFYFDLKKMAKRGIHQ